MAAPRPGNTDRGWNDPPIFDYQGTSSGVGGGHQHHKLNKRVAYPLSPSCPAATGTSTLLNPSDGPPRLPTVHILPPSTTTTTPAPVPVLIPTLSPTTDPSQPALFSPVPSAGPAPVSPAGSTSLDVKVKNLDSLLTELSLDSEDSLLEYIQDGLKGAVDSVKDTLKGRAKEDVRKKLELMQERWKANKISQPVKSQMGSLVAALNKQDVETAHEVHLALMINHTTEVNQWLVGIKRIIQELRSKASELQVNQGEGQAQLVMMSPSSASKTDVVSSPQMNSNNAESQDMPASTATDSQVSVSAAEEQS